MKKVFTYGILQRHHSSERFGMTDDMYLGRATLVGFKRDGLCHIHLSDNKFMEVEGDLWNVPDELEQQLYEFEAQFGYERVKVTIVDEKGIYHRVIVYLVDWKNFR